MVFIYTQIYLTSFFLNEFNSPCVSKLPNVSNIMMLTLKLYSYRSYFTLVFGDLTVNFYSIFFNQLM